MKKRLLIAATAAFLFTAGVAPAQFVPNQGQGYGKSQPAQKGRRSGPNDGTGNQVQRPKDGTGYGVKSSKRTGAGTCTGTPQGAQRRGARR